MNLLHTVSCRHHLHHSTFVNQPEGRYCEISVLMFDVAVMKAAIIGVAIHILVIRYLQYRISMLPGYIHGAVLFICRLLLYLLHSRTPTPEYT